MALTALAEAASLGTSTTSATLARRQYSNEDLDVTFRGSTLTSPRRSPRPVQAPLKVPLAAEAPSQRPAHLPERQPIGIGHW
eukprot:CAMPEP_0170632088 /NCGR_PEP_ID=MMETSP0224-20130122/35067_1 /TAXON_ID=285029 /ORGANISM="Togula jolla, Strain CCCM 725" /LENGTH=81 /DNA_ID=CAMNT_0010960629 /DNA_START=36 /DNA_END=278 /DNA_ORIENTATION=-